jgi:hypothetical protein
MSNLKRKPSEGAKSRFEYIARQLFSELKKAQESLIEAITNLNLTGTFGEAKINDVKRLEATILCLPVAEVSYFDSDGFKNTNDKEIYDWLMEVHDSLIRREHQLFVAGLDVKQHWEASGVMQAKAELKRSLNIN